jgi:prepilin-type processing-associated H-X9-DG protein/prepilin-type N-terminal cleavage/methylation domain-containing protein
MVPHRYFARAFTLLELLVIMAVIAILITIAYPVYTGVLERGKVTQDMSDLRQIGIAIQTYLNDNDQILPDITTWPGTSVMPALYPKYIATRKIFQSPFDKRPGLETDLAPVSYGINHNMYDPTIGISRNFTRVVSPASTFLTAPTYSGDPKNASSWSGTMTNPPDLLVGGAGETKGTHSNGNRINVLFCDWHVENLTFGPPATANTFQNTTLAPFHWDPRQ